MFQRDFLTVPFLWKGHNLIGSHFFFESEKTVTRRSVHNDALMRLKLFGTHALSNFQMELHFIALLAATLFASALSSDPSVPSFAPVSIAPIAPVSLAPSDPLVCNFGLSCLDRCNVYHIECTCQCDGDCSVVGDCCHDISDVCGIVAVAPIVPSTQVPIAPGSSSSPVSPIAPFSLAPVSQLCDSGISCEGRCATFHATCGCQCDSTCSESGDCCDDFATQCSAPVDISESPTVLSSTPSQSPVVAPTDPPSDPPTDLPTTVPTDLPTTAPADLPTTAARSRTPVGVVRGMGGMRGKAKVKMMGKGVGRMRKSGVGKDAVGDEDGDLSSDCRGRTRMFRMMG